MTTVTYRMQPAKLRHLNQLGAITVSAFSSEGRLPSELLDQVMPAVKDVERNLPHGMSLEIAGEFTEQAKSF